MTRHHRPGGLNNVCLFCHTAGGWKAKAKVQAGLAPSEVTALGLQVAALALGGPCVLGASGASLCPDLPVL